MIYLAGWSFACAIAAGIVGLTFAHSQKGCTLAHAFQVVAFLLALPHPSNYHTTNAFISVAWLFFIFGYRSEKDFKSGVLVIFSLVYAFAGFIKLNGCFLNVELSPARALIENHRLAAPVMEMISQAFGHDIVPAVTRGGIVAIIVLELAIPPLLLMPRTRLFGLGLDLILHLIMGLRVIPVSLNFPLLSIAVWTLWLPRGSLGLIPRWVPRLTGRRNALLRFGLAGCIVGLALSVRHGIAAPLPVALANLIWLMALLLLLLWWWAIAGNQRFRSSARYFQTRMAPWGGCALVILLVANGIFPYLGIKTMGSLEMFSGYLHLGGRTNHLLIPPVEWWGDQTQRWVQILDSTDETLRRYAEAEVAVSWIEFRRLCNRASGDASVSYWEAGEVRDVPAIANDPELGKPLGWFHRYVVNTMKVPLPRLSELGLATAEPTRLPQASDTLFLTP